MLPHLIMLGRTPIPFGTPSIDSLTAGTHLAGDCDGGAVLTDAQFRISWTLSDVRVGDYVLLVYEDGVMKQQYDASQTNHTVIVAGYIEDGAAPFLYDETWKLEVVRLYDDAIVATDTVQWTKQYGTCGGGGA